MFEKYFVSNSEDISDPKIFLNWFFMINLENYVMNGIINTNINTKAKAIVTAIVILVITFLSNLFFNKLFNVISKIRPPSKG